MRNPYATIPRLSFTRKPQTVSVVGWVPDAPDCAPRYIDVVTDSGERRRLPASKHLLDQLAHLICKFDRADPLGARITVATVQGRASYVVESDESWTRT